MKNLLAEQYAPVPVYQLQRLGDWADWLEGCLASTPEDRIAPDMAKDLTNMVAFLRAVGIPADAVFEMEAKK